MKGKDYPQLKQSEWLSDLAFAVDLFENMNELNTKLQGKGTFAHEMYSTVKAFRVKLKLFSVVVVVYPTPSEGWGHGGRPWSPRSRATPQGLDQRS